MHDSHPIYHVQSPVLDTFVAEVQGIVAQEPNRVRTVKLLRPAFARLLGDQTWLPASFTQPDPSGGMGQGVGNYPIFRSAQRDLSLMSLVQVRTLGSRPSVSLHLLGNDIGCTWRHRYDPHGHRVYPFRSGYSNEECEDKPSQSQLRPVP